MTETIRVKGLDAHHDKTDILHDINLSLTGGFTAIAGPNGAGKSTLLKYLIREYRTDDDTVFLMDDDINLLKQKEIAKRISFEGQSGTRNDEFTVGEMVSMGRFAYGDIRSSEATVDEALRKTSIFHLKNRSVTKISGGEFQLAMLARAICQDTGILALDEPANNLDPKHQKLLLGLLSDLAKSGKTVLCVLHDLNSILAYSDRCILMKDGRIMSYGNTDEVLTIGNVKDVYGIDARIYTLEPSGRKLMIF